MSELMKWLLKYFKSANSVSGITQSIINSFVMQPCHSEHEISFHSLLNKEQEGHWMSFMIGQFPKRPCCVPEKAIVYIHTALMKAVLKAMATLTRSKIPQGSQGATKPNFLQKLTL